MSSSTTSPATVGKVKMVITEGGNVGIGTSSPTSIGGYTILSINNASNSGLLDIQNNGTSVAWLYGSSTAAVLQAVGTTTSLTFQTNSTERMRITSGGDVGIGTTGGINVASGWTNLTVNGSTTGIIGVQIAGTNFGAVYGNLANNNFVLQAYGTSNTGNMVFLTNSTERMRITSGGNVLIGTTTDNGYKQNINTSSGGIYVQNSSNTDNIDSIITYTSFTKACYVASVADTASLNGFFYYGQANGVKTYAVYPNGNVQNTNGSYGTLSDIRLKENVVNATPKLENLLKVRVVNYNLKAPYNTEKQIGVIAQELEEIFPGLVYETKDKDSNEITKGVKYSIFVPMLIKAMQEQQEQITSLQDRLSKLENK